MAGGGDLEVDTVGHGHDEGAGLLTTVDSLPDAWHHATRSPTADAGDPGPTAVTVPAPSSPSDERRRDGVDALALVDVDEVDAGGGDLDLHLALAGVGEVVVADLQDGAVAGLGDEDAGRSVHARHPTTDDASASGEVGPAAPMRTRRATSSSRAASRASGSGTTDSSAMIPMRTASS